MVRLFRLQCVQMSCTLKTYREARMQLVRTRFPPNASFASSSALSYGIAALKIRV
jgi:hypothetical protein